MSVQLNLLPDVKSQYIKAERNRNLAIGISLIVLSICAGVLILIYASLGAQNLALNNSDKKIDEKSQELKNIKDIEKMLTVQAQLNSLDGLHNAKPVNSRAFAYIAQVTPPNVQISDLTINHTDNTMVITGTTNNLESVNKFVDTLKFTNYKLPGSEQVLPAFSKVTLSSFSRNDQGATFTINLTFDPALFNTASDGIQLVVKEGVTTRTNPLFNAQQGAN